MSAACPLKCNSGKSGGIWHPLGVLGRGGPFGGAVAALSGVRGCPGAQGAALFHGITSTSNHQIMLRLKHVCPETCFRINKPTLSKPNKLMSNSATPPPAARASNTPTAAELTPDSLCEQAFEKDMERILHYQEKFPKLDTAGMITKAMAEREARKQVAFDDCTTRTALSVCGDDQTHCRRSALSKK